MSDLIERLKRCDNGPFPPNAIGTAMYRNPDGPEAAQAITTLTAERDALKAEKWRAQHVDTMNDAVLKGLAMKSLTAENERLREHLSGVVHEAEWMIDAVRSLNENSRIAVRDRIKRAKAALKEQS